MRNFRVAASYLTPVVACLLISLGFVKLFTLGGLVRSLPILSPGSHFDQFVWALIPTSFGLLGVTFLYWLIARRRGFELRVILAIIVAPTSAILVIIISQTILLVVAKAVSYFIASLLILASLYMAVFSIIFILGNVFSTRVRNLIFILYGALLGSFVSLLLPTISLIVLLIAVALYDLFMLNSGWIIDIARHLDSSRRADSRLSYVGENIEIGMGEFIFYSFIPAHVEAFYGLDLLALTLAMTSVGIVLNLWMLAKRSHLAGLPAPILLGLIPLVIHLVSG